MLAEAAKIASQTTGIVSALRTAATATGADFHYLLSTAMRESSLNPEARAATSSATGLFQFVEQTWLGLVKDYGAKYGLGGYADAITREANGHCRVASSADRQAILALRQDPQLSAYMEGELAQATRSNLKANLGRRCLRGRGLCSSFSWTGCGLPADRTKLGGAKRQRRGSISPGGQRKPLGLLSCRRDASDCARGL